jgi:NAD(P)-dependent dehydrogenase (short-subunit alcohol dehydrogenase family)
MGTLDDKAVIVTGAGRGIGEAIALRAAAQGASVVVNDVDAEAARKVVDNIRAAGGKAAACPGSIAEWSFAQELTAACVTAFGKLDGLVNNAALHYLELPWDESEQRVRQLIEVNVLGTLYCGIHALKAMVGRRQGSIVNVTSGAHMGMALRSTYGASKGAVASLTYGWALEAMPYNVRVNAMSPIANTPMTRESVEEEARKYPDRAPPPATAFGLAPQTLAPLVLYLLSDLSEGVTGQIVRMAGKHINLVAHPQTAPPFIEDEGWSETSLAAAFDSTLRSHLKPVGVTASKYEWKPAP